MDYRVLPLSYHIMAKPIGPVCNLNCTYCYYLEKNKIYKNTRNFIMSDEVLEAYIKQYIQYSEAPTLTFTWQGGEPTLPGIDFFKKVLALQNKWGYNRKIENSFQTNGTMLNDEWCRLFRDNNFLIGISIDGPREIHDHYRLQKTGSGSFDKVMEGIELLKKHNVEFNTLTVVPRVNSDYPLEIYGFLKDIGSQYIQFIPIVERLKDGGEDEIKLIAPVHGEAEVTEWTVIPKDYGTFLIKIFDEWVRKDVGQTFVQIFDVTLANWVGQPGGLCVFSETCGNAMVLEHNGDLYSCDHFVYPEYLLGNILHDDMRRMALSERQFHFGYDKLQSLPNYCINCEYRFACHGECLKHRFVNTPDGQPGLNYLCQAYKMFFSYVHPYMQYMADELKAKRPPANIMRWARQFKRKYLV